MRKKQLKELPLELITWKWVVELEQGTNGPLMNIVISTIRIYQPSGSKMVQAI